MKAMTALRGMKLMFIDEEEKAFTCPIKVHRFDLGQCEGRTHVARESNSVNQSCTRAVVV